MIRRPPRSTLLSLHDALPISDGLPVVLAEAVDGIPLLLQRLMGVAVGLLVESGIAQAEVSREIDHLRPARQVADEDRKSTRLNSSHANISYAVFCLKKKQSST